MKYRKKATSSLLKTSAPNLYMTALKYFQEKDFSKAILLFQELLKHPLIKANNYLQAILLFNIALCLQKNKDYAEAIKLYCRSCVRGIGWRGWSAITWLLSQQDFQLGSQQRQVIKQIIDSSNIESLGYSGMLSRKNQDALRKFSSAASQLPSPVNVVNLGIVCKQQQRCDLLRDYKKILTFIARYQNQLGEKACQVLQFIQQSTNSFSYKKNQIKVRNVSKSVGRAEKREQKGQNSNKILLEEQMRYKKKESIGVSTQQPAKRAQSKRVSFAEQQSWKIAQLKTGAYLQSFQQMSRDEQLQRSQIPIFRPESKQTQDQKQKNKLSVKVVQPKIQGYSNQPLSIHNQTDTQSSLKCQNIIKKQQKRISRAPQQLQWQMGWRWVEQGHVQKGFEMLEKGLQVWLLQKQNFKQEIIKYIKLIIYFRRRTQNFSFIVLTGLHTCLDQEVYEELYLKIQLLIVCKQYFQASAIIQLHIHLYPQLNFLMSDLLEQQGSITQSIRSMQIYLKEGGNKRDILKLCRLLVKADRIDQAIHLSKDLSMDQQSLKLRLMIAQRMDDKREFLRLRSELNLLEGSTCHFSHIIQMLKAEMIQQTQKYVKKVSPQLKKQQICFIKSCLEYSHGHYRRAFHYLAQVQEDSLQLELFTLHKAHVLFRLKKYQESKANYLRAQLRQELSVESSTQLAICYFHTRKYQSAQDIFLKLVQKNQDSFQIRFNLGCTQFALNKVQQAQKNFERALQIKQQDAHCQYCLLVCRYLLGKQLHALSSITQLDSGRYRSCSEYLKNNFKPVGVAGFQD